MVYFLKSNWLRVWIATIFLFWTNKAFCQDIKGSIVDTNNVAIPYASVILKTDDSNILSFSTSDDKGKFILKNTIEENNRQTLYIEVSCLGFKGNTKVVTNKQLLYNFILSVDNNQLHDVTVKSPASKVKTKGDTTNFKASDFSAPQDRVIGDVLKKIPGIEMDENGKIKYNGKAISNLYVGGDNLLDDRYNIATKTIPNQVVDLVQIMENHQPIKMLRNKVNSNDVAINLTFKKEAKIGVVGQETIGGGVPEKVFGESNAMTFKNSFKAIDYIKINNIGEDVKNDLVSHNQGDYLNRIDNFPPVTLLSLGTASNPDLPVNRYLFNQSGLVNLNNLAHLQDEVIIRSNIYYYHDSQRQNYQKLTKLFLPKDTIQYTENQGKYYRPDNIHSEINLNINKSKYYLNDVLLTDFSNDGYKSDLSTQTGNINQTLSYKSLNLSNELNLMKEYNNKILEFYSFINYLSAPEKRTIDTNYNSALYDFAVPYNSLVQAVNVPTFFINNYVSTKLTGNKVTQSYKLGISSQTQSLNSELGITTINNQYQSNLDSSKNDLRWLRNKFYGEAKYDFVGSVLKGTVGLPVYLQSIGYNSQIYNLRSSLVKLYVNPDVNLKYLFTSENYISLSYQLKNAVGSIEDIYPGYILLTYRTLQANSAKLAEQQTQNTQLGLSLKKSIILLYFNLSIGYTKVNSNTINSSEITNTGEKSVIIPFANNTNSYNVTSFLSKYVFNVHTNLSLTNSLQLNSSNQITNGNFLSYKNYINNLTFDLQSTISKTFNFSYNCTLTNMWNATHDSDLNNNLFQLKQRVAIFFNLSQSIYLKVSGDNYISQQLQTNKKNYSFLDATVRYKLNKLKSDVEFGAYNILNTTTYSGVYLSANNYTATNYQIPGRYLLVKYQFTL